MRADIEESKNLAEKRPDKAQEMEKELFHRLDSMNASYPYFNPHFKGILPGIKDIPSGVKNGRKGNAVWAQFKDDRSKVTNGQVVYTLNGGEKSEEWYLADARIVKGRLIAELPVTTTHYVFNFIDEHNFLVSYPDMPDLLTAGKRKGKGPYSQEAF